MIPTPTPPPIIEGYVLDFGNVNMGENMAVHAIQTWNMANQTDILTGFQFLIIIVIILFGVGAIISMLNRL